MSVLVFGANGQVGQELLKALASQAVIATTRSGILPDGTPCETADFDHPEILPQLLDRLSPKIVINAAAYTAVDKAETEREAAFRANAEAPEAMAQWCAKHEVPLVHYSTDYVFDGQGTRPYEPNDATAPLGVYGASKLAGEQAIRSSGAQHYIFRTAWVYAAHGHNFLKTMLRLGAERDELRVVADQIGTPTPAWLIAEVTVQALKKQREISGTWHLTAQGETSWHGFAEEIFTQAKAHGLLDKTPAITPITTDRYPTPAKRPAYSCLNTHTLLRDFDVPLPSWQDGIARVMGQAISVSSY